MSLNDKLSKYKRIRDVAIAEYRQAKAGLASSKESLASAKKQTTYTETAQIILQESAKTVQQRAHARISKVVTKCLESVFDQPYQFVILFEKKRGRTEAKLLFVREGMEVSARAIGGGVVDVASFGLRLACLVLSRPTQRRVFIADEPFKHVSVKYRPRIRQLLEVLSKDMGIQFILVTHSKHLQVGKVVEVAKW